MKKTAVILFAIIAFTAVLAAEEGEYTLGAGDILEVRILKPDEITSRTTVSPSGNISVAYLGSVKVKGKTISQVQKLIQYSLARGYLKYPVVVINLIESHSRNYTVSGEVVRPGTYPLGENTTVLKAISTAGGFTRFGSKSRVKLLRPKKDGPGYITIKINLRKAMKGDANSDVILKPGDVVVVSEGIF